MAPTALVPAMGGVFAGGFCPRGRAAPRTIDEVYRALVATGWDGAPRRAPRYVDFLLERTCGVRPDNYG